MHRTALIATVAALALSACGETPSEGRAPGAAPAFTYAAAGDLSGYFMPMDEVRAGPWKLDHVFVGQAPEFQAWAAGERSASFAPVMLQFHKAGSSAAGSAPGEAAADVARVLPTSYEVSDVQVRFEGRSAELGLVRFDGRLDQGALATARRNLGDESAVLTGSLKIGDARPQAVRLRWWMGD